MTKTCPQLTLTAYAKRWATDENIAGAREVFRRWFMVNYGRFIRDDWSRPPTPLDREYIDAGGR